MGSRDRSRSPPHAGGLFGWDDQNPVDDVADGHDGQDSFASDLVNLLLTQFCLGKMDAKTLCNFCWLAANAGARGDGLERLGYPPGRQTGKYSAHLKKFLPVDCSDFLFTVRDSWACQGASWTDERFDGSATSCIGRREVELKVGERWH